MAKISKKEEIISSFSDGRMLDEVGRWMLECWQATLAGSARGRDRGGEIVVTWNTSAHARQPALHYSFAIRDRTVYDVCSDLEGRGTQSDESVMATQSGIGSRITKNIADFVCEWFRGKALGLKVGHSPH